jgi:hypothetical protein
MREVESQNNPCKAIWDEFKAHKINLEEMLTAVYSFALSDPNCDYNFMATPPKPSDLDVEERRFKQLSDSMTDTLEKRKAYAKFQDQIHVKYKGYFARFGELSAMNASNLKFVREMHDFFKDKNLAFEQITRKIITTHEYGIFKA